MIKIENLHKRFGKLEVLNGIDINVEKGEIIAIIGPSGSGKSTLIKLMFGIEKTLRGNINIFNKSINLPNSISCEDLLKPYKCLSQNFLYSFAVGEKETFVLHIQQCGLPFKSCIN